MRLLLHLCEHVDQTCSRDGIMESVWPDSEPNEETLTQAVSKLRKALGDSNRSLIRTVRKVGYRLNGPVTTASTLVEDPNTDGTEEVIDHAETSASGIDASTDNDINAPDASTSDLKAAPDRKHLRIPSPSRWIWKAAAVVLVGFAISRFKVVAVHHDGAESPRMVAVRMMDDGTMIRSHAVEINPDALEGTTLTWHARKTLSLPLDTESLPEAAAFIGENADEGNSGGASELSD